MFAAIRIARVVCRRILPAVTASAILVGPGLAARPLAAQVVAPRGVPVHLVPPAHGDHVKLLAINAALGGLTAGVMQHARGHSFVDGFVRGAAGGGVAYAGRTVAGRRWNGAGLVGRQVSATGASMVANAAAGRGMLERVMLPIGPVRLAIDRATSLSVQPRVDLLATAAIAYAAFHPDFEMDWGASLSAGTAVFLERSPVPLAGSYTAGRMLGGAITVRREPGSEAWAGTLAHEQVHLAQHDFSAIVWGEPLEGWLLGMLPGGGAVHRHIDLGFDFLVWGSLQLLAGDRQSRPWEREAYFLAGQRSRL
jgi:hypothetical protein